jgi:hypothetical protein
LTVCAPKVRQAASFSTRPLGSALATGGTLELDDRGRQRAQALAAHLRERAGEDKS